jgi:hypothetical protein
VLRRAAIEARDDDVPTVAQALAYSLFLAIPASMLIVLGTFSLLADEGTVASLIDRMQDVMPAETADLLRDSLKRSTRSAGSGVVMTLVGFGLALWITTSAATTLAPGVWRVRALQRELRLLRQDVGNALRRRGDARVAMADERGAPLRRRGERRGTAAGARARVGHEPRRLS